MSHDEAVHWLAKRGLYPLSCNDGTSGRWYPDVPSNRMFYQEHYRLLDVLPYFLIPESLYYRLDFPRPNHWIGHYPWFEPYEKAIVSAIEALMRSDIAPDEFVQPEQIRKIPSVKC